MDEGTRDSRSGDSNIPSGYTFLGQFIDHDITLDPESSLSALDQVATEFENFRTPNLDLDCIYASGPEVTPFIYDSKKRLLLGDAIADSDAYDLPRFKQRALIGDPRNDENLVLSQLQVAFLKFHNALMDATDDFEITRRTAIHYYHRMIKEDFLPRVIGAPLTKNIIKERNFYFQGGLSSAPRRPYMPIEFSICAYRFGHSMVRGRYSLNNKYLDNELFGGNLMLQGFKPAKTYIDWQYFFDTPGVVDTTCARKIDPFLPSTLMDLKVANVVDAEPVSLAVRNLHRGLAFNMWSGQSVARQMIASGVLGVNVHQPDRATQEAGMSDTPLWYYILQDSLIETDGQTLGPVGGRIVGEVLIGLIEHYWIKCGHERWEPEVMIPCEKEDRVQITDILRFAGVL